MMEGLTFELADFEGDRHVPIPRRSPANRARLSNTAPFPGFLIGGTYILQPGLNHLLFE
jgi:hypothetical protein